MANAKPYGRRMWSVEIKIDFRRGAIGSLGIIAGPSEYVKEDIDREIKQILERLLRMKKWTSL